MADSVVAEDLRLHRTTKRHGTSRETSPRSDFRDVTLGKPRLGCVNFFNVPADDAFLKGNALGMAVGQPVFATALTGGQIAQEGNFTWEWWYKLQVTDSISVTPALFYLSRSIGQDTTPGTTFRQLGGLVKTTFRF